MILYVENPKDFMKKSIGTNKQIQQSSRIQGQYTIISYFSIHKQWTSWKGNLETIPSTITSKRAEYLGINQEGERLIQWKLQNIAERNLGTHKEMETYSMFMN